MAFFRSNSIAPSELFRPYFSQILGNFIAKEMTSPPPSKGDPPNSTSHRDECFQVIELGGGRGTNALCILNHLMNVHPDIYHRLESYTILDVSPTLLNIQQRMIVGEDSSTKTGSESRHGNKIKFIQLDLMDVAETK